MLAKSLVSGAAVVFIIARLIWPELKVDPITLVLVIVAVLPWLSSLIESTKFPGGWEVKFRDVQRANPSWRHHQTATLRVPAWNSLRWEAANGFPGLRWYSLEPARLNAFVTLHHFHHEFQYGGRLSGYEIGKGFIDHGEEEELRTSLVLAREYVESALSLDVLFGANGIDFFTTPLPGFGVVPIAVQLKDAVKAADKALEALRTRAFDFMSLAALLGRLSHALVLFSSAISAYQGFRQKFLLTETSAVWRAGATVHGLDGPPIMPTDRQRSRGAYLRARARRFALVLRADARVRSSQALGLSRIPEVHIMTDNRQ